MSKLQQLKDAFAQKTPDWVVIPPGEEGNDSSNIEIHDAFGRTATVYGELDIENFATANFMVLSDELMPLLFEAVEIVRSNHIGNARAETLLAKLDSADGQG